MMTISTKVHEALLREVLVQCGAGKAGGKGVISFYEAPRPASPNDVVRQLPLASVPIRRDSIQVEEGEGGCCCNEGVVHRAGQANWARVTRDGAVVMDMDVGMPPAKASILLNNTALVNGAITLRRFTVGVKF